MQCFVLVDYDNLKVIEERRTDEVDYNLNHIANLASIIRRDQFSKAHEIVLRLYGGWLDVNGRYTHRASLLARVIHKIRGRRNGARVSPEMALSLLCQPTHRLTGTLRSSAQKMVDTMICVDAIFASRETDCPVAVLSDDDDMVPGLVYSATIRSGTYCSRRRAAGAGINDKVVSEVGAIIGVHNV